MQWHNQRAASLTHAILRIVIGFLFMSHGAQKLLGWFGGVGPSHGTVPLVSIMGLAGVLELLGGFLLLIGLFTRPVAFVLAGEMAVAYFTVHFPNAFWPIVNQGELAALYAFVFLFFAFNGAGRLSVDGRFRARAPESPVVTQPLRRRGRAA